VSAVIVLGARGMLGRAVSSWLSARGHQVLAYGRAELDVAREPPEKLDPLVAGADLVVNCAAVVKPRIAVTPVEDVLRVNAIFPRNLARACARARRRCLHVTTDAVFSGKRGGYTELDPFDPTDLYGLSKAAGEPEGAMVLRTSLVGEEGSAARSLLEWARSQAGRRVSGFANHRWNGVTTMHLAEVIAAILEGGLHRDGTFHVFSPQTVTKAELLQAISDAYGLGLVIEQVDAEVPCDRSLASIHPLSGQLCTKPIGQQLHEMRAFFQPQRPP